MLRKGSAGTRAVAWMDDSGATAVEYGLFVALIAAVIIATVSAVGIGLAGAFSLTWP
jgi:Flp pilus assembly pilin Flp